MKPEIQGCADIMNCFTAGSRPTAVNLAEAATNLLNICQAVADKGDDAEAVYQVRTLNNSLFL